MKKKVNKLQKVIEEVKSIYLLEQQYFVFCSISCDLDLIDPNLISQNTLNILNRKL